MASDGGGIGGLLKQTTAGVPNWGWLLAIVGGIGAALLLPKFFGNQSATASDQTSTNQGATNAGLPDTIDPLTGVPYAVETATNPTTGLPAYYGTGLGYTGQGTTLGSTIGTEGQAVNLPPVSTGASGTPPPPAPSGQGNPSGPGGVPAPPHPIPTPHPVPHPAPAPHPSPQRFVSPTKWPTRTSTLTGIAAANGVSLSRLEALNPWILQQRGTWNLIYPTDRIRVA